MSDDVRLPARAGSFYPATGEDCAAAIAELHAEAVALPAHARGVAIRGGIVPHAGWSFSGPTACAVFEALKAAQPRPETVVVFATAHRPDVDLPSLQAAGQWQTPCGRAEIDAELAAAMLREAGPELLMDRALAHERDHAVEVQLPLLLDALPGTRFVPVAVPIRPLGTELGAAAARAAQKLGRKTAFLASVDLTHYGPNYYGFAPHGTGPEAHRWSKEVNDARFLERALALDAAGAYEAGEADQSCCGPAAAAAAAAACKASGATQGVLLEHITSWERGKDGPPSDFVGYAGLVWL